MRTAVLGAATALAAFVTAAAEPAADPPDLSALSGRYELTSTFWPAPGAEPVVTRLTAHRRLVTAGRVLRTDVGSAADGFEGTGLMGYDQASGRHWYVWTDTTVHGRALLEGEIAADGSGRLTGTTPGPAGYQPLTVEIETDGRVETHRYLSPGADGEPRQWLELRYRKLE